MSSSGRTLLLGWGNPGRQDDGLGPALALAMRDGAADGLTVESDYQLQIEDAAEVSEHDRVVFVDADRSGPEPFSCRAVAAADGALGFSSHSVTPAALLALTRQLFGREPEAWLVGIRGYDFDEFDESLSTGAEANLAAAETFIRRSLEDGGFREVPVSLESEMSSAKLEEAAK